MPTTQYVIMHDTELTPINLDLSLPDMVLRNALLPRLTRHIVKTLSNKSSYKEIQNALRGKLRAWGHRDVHYQYSIRDTLVRPDDTDPKGLEITITAYVYSHNPRSPGCTIWCPGCHSYNMSQWNMQNNVHSYFTTSNCGFALTPLVLPSILSRKCS